MDFAGDEAMDRLAPASKKNSRNIISVCEFVSILSQDMECLIDVLKWCLEIFDHKVLELESVNPLAQPSILFTLIHYLGIF